MAPIPSFVQSVGTFVATYAVATTATVIPVLVVRPGRYERSRWERALKKALAASGHNFRYALLPVFLPIVYRAADRFLTPGTEDASDPSAPKPKHLRIVKRFRSVLPAILSSPLFALLPDTIRTEVALYFFSTFLYTFADSKSRNKEIKFEDDDRTKDASETKRIWQRSKKEILENWRDYLPPAWTVSMLANTCLLWTFIFEPYAFPERYHDAIIKHSSHYLPRSRPLDDIRQLLATTSHPHSEACCSPHSFVLCEHLHPSEISCFKNFFAAFKDEAVKFGGWVAGATVVSMLISGKLQFGKRKFTLIIFEFIDSAVRGTAFLSGSITSVWALSCVLQRIIPEGRFSKSRWIINSSLSSMWILLLSQSQQFAVSLYQFRLATFSIWKVWKARGGRSIKHGELWLIAACWVALLHYKDKSVGNRITGVIGQLMGMIDGSEWEEWNKKRKKSKKGKGKGKGKVEETITIVGDGASGRKFNGFTTGGVNPLSVPGFVYPGKAYSYSSSETHVHATSGAVTTINTHGTNADYYHGTASSSGTHGHVQGTASTITNTHGSNADYYNGTASSSGTHGHVQGTAITATTTNTHGSNADYSHGTASSETHITYGSNADYYLGNQQSSSTASSNTVSQLHPRPRSPLPEVQITHGGHSASSTTAVASVVKGSSSTHTSTAQSSSTHTSSVQGSFSHTSGIQGSFTNTSGVQGSSTHTSGVQGSFTHSSGVQGSSTHTSVAQSSSGSHTTVQGVSSTHTSAAHGSSSHSSSSTKTAVYGGAIGAGLATLAGWFASAAESDSDEPVSKTTHVTTTTKTDGGKTTTTTSTTTTQSGEIRGILKRNPTPRRSGSIPRASTPPPLKVDIPSMQLKGGGMAHADGKMKVTIKDEGHARDTHDTIAVHMTNTDVSIAGGTETKGTVTFEEKKGHSAGMATAATIAATTGTVTGAKGQMSLPTPPNSSIPSAHPHGVVVSPSSDSNTTTYVRDTATTAISNKHPVPETPGGGQYATHGGYNTTLGLPTPASAWTPPTAGPQPNQPSNWELYGKPYEVQTPSTAVPSVPSPPPSKFPDGPSRPDATIPIRPAVPAQPEFVPARPDVVISQPHRPDLDTSRPAVVVVPAPARPDFVPARPDIAVRPPVMPASSNTTTVTAILDDKRTSSYKDTHDEKDVSASYGGRTEQVITALPISIGVEHPSHGGVSVVDTKVTMGKVGSHQDSRVHGTTQVDTITNTISTDTSGKTHSTSVGLGGSIAVSGDLSFGGKVTHTQPALPTVTSPSYPIPATPVLEVPRPHKETSTTTTTTTVHGTLGGSLGVHGSCDGTSSSSNTTTVATIHDDKRTSSYKGTRDEKDVSVSYGGRTEQVINAFPISIGVEHPSHGGVSVVDTKVTMGKVDSHQDSRVHGTTQVDTITNTISTDTAGKTHSTSLGFGGVVAVSGDLSFGGKLTHTQPALPTVTSPSHPIPATPVLEPSRPHKETSTSTTTTTVHGTLGGSLGVHGSFDGTSSSSNTTTVTTTHDDKRTSSYKGTRDEKDVSVYYGGRTEQVINALPISIGVEHPSNGGVSVVDTKVTMGKADSHHDSRVQSTTQVDTITNTISTDTGKSHSTSFGFGGAVAVSGDLSLSGKLTHTQPALPTETSTTTTTTTVHGTLGGSVGVHGSIDGTSSTTTTTSSTSGSTSSVTQLPTVVSVQPSRQGVIGQETTVISVAPRPSASVQGTAVVSTSSDGKTTFVHQDSHGVAVISSEGSSQQVVSKGDSITHTHQEGATYGSTSSTWNTTKSHVTDEKGRVFGLGGVIDLDSGLGRIPREPTPVVVLQGSADSSSATATTTHTTVTTEKGKGQFYGLGLAADVNIDGAIYRNPKPASSSAVSVHGTSVTHTDSTSTSIHKDSQETTVFSSGGRTEQVTEIHQRPAPTAVTVSAPSAVSTSITSVTVEKGDSVTHGHHDSTVTSSNATSSTETTTIGKQTSHSFGLGVDVDIDVDIGLGATISRGPKRQSHPHASTSTSTEISSSAVVSSSSGSESHSHATTIGQSSSTTSSSTIGPRPAPVPLQPLHPGAGGELTTTVISQGVRPSSTTVESVSVHGTSVTTTNADSKSTSVHKDSVTVVSANGSQQVLNVSAPASVAVIVDRPAKSTSGSVLTSNTTAAKTESVSIHGTSVTSTSVENTHTSAHTDSQGVVVVSSSGPSRLTHSHQDVDVRGSTVTTASSGTSSTASSTSVATTEKQSSHTIGLSFGLGANVNVSGTISQSTQPSRPHLDSSTSTSTSTSSVVIGATDSKTHTAHGTVVETSSTNATFSSSEVQRPAPVPVQPSIQIVDGKSKTTTTIGSSVSDTRVTVENGGSVIRDHRDVTVHGSTVGGSSSTSSTETSVTVGKGKTHSFGLSAGVDVSLGISASGSVSHGSSTQIESATKSKSDSHSTAVIGSFESGTHVQGTSTSTTSTTSSSDVHRQSGAFESISIESSNQAVHGGAHTTGVSTTLASTGSSVKSTEVVSATKLGTSVTTTETESRDTSLQKKTKEAVVVSTSSGVQQVDTSRQSSNIGISIGAGAHFGVSVTGSTTKTPQPALAQVSTSTSTSTSSSSVTASAQESKTHVVESTALTASTTVGTSATSSSSVIHRPAPTPVQPSHQIVYAGVLESRGSATVASSESHASSAVIGSVTDQRVSTTSATVESTTTSAHRDERTNTRVSSSTENVSRADEVRQQSSTSIGAGVGMVVSIGGGVEVGKSSSEASRSTTVIGAAETHTLRGATASTSSNVTTSSSDIQRQTIASESISVESSSHNDTVTSGHSTTVQKFDDTRKQSSSVGVDVKIGAGLNVGGSVSLGSKKGHDSTVTTTSTAATDSFKSKTHAVSETTSATTSSSLVTSSTASASGSKVASTSIQGTAMTATEHGKTTTSLQGEAGQVVVVSHGDSRTSDTSHQLSTTVTETGSTSTVTVKQGVAIGVHGGVAETHSSAVNVTTVPGKAVTVVRKKGRKAKLHAGATIGIGGSISSSTVTSVRPRRSSASSGSSSGSASPAYDTHELWENESAHALDASASASGSEEAVMVNLTDSVVQGTAVMATQSGATVEVTQETAEAARRGKGFWRIGERIEQVKGAVTGAVSGAVSGGIGVNVDANVSVNVGVSGSLSGSRTSLISSQEKDTSSTTVVESASASASKSFSAGATGSVGLGAQVALGASSTSSVAKATASAAATGSASASTSSIVQVQGTSSESTSLQVSNQKTYGGAAASEISTTVTSPVSHTDPIMIESVTSVGGSVTSSEIESTKTSLQIQPVLGMSLKGGGRRFDSGVQQESTSTTVMIESGGSHFDSNTHQQSSTTASEVNTTTSSTEIKPVLGMSLKGGGRRFDSDVQQSSSTASEVNTTTSSTEIVGMSLKGGGRRFDSDVQQESTSTTVIKGGGSHFDSDVHQSSTTTSEHGTTTTGTDIGLIAGVSLKGGGRRFDSDAQQEVSSTTVMIKGGGSRFDSDSHQQSSSTTSEVNTTTSSTEIRPVLGMSLKGGGMRFDSDARQSSTTTSELGTTTSSTDIGLIAGMSLKGGGRRFDSDSHEQSSTTTSSTEIRPVLGMSVKGGGMRFDSDAHQSSTTTSELGTTTSSTDIGLVAGMSLKGGGMRFDSDAHQQSSTTSSEIATTTSSTEIRPILGMSLKGGGMRFDSDAHQQSSTTSSEIETTTSNTEIRPVLGMSLKGGGMRFDSASHQESSSASLSTEVASTAVESTEISVQQSKGGSRRLGRTSPLPTLMPLTVGPPSMFMTGMESPFTPSTSSMVEKDSGVVVEVHGRTGDSASVSATRQTFSSSSEIKTSSSEIRSSSFTAGASSTSTTTATATLGLGAAGTVTTSTLLASPRSPHTAVAFHSSEAPRSPHTAAAFHSSELPRSPHSAVAFHSSELPRSPHTAVAFHSSEGHSEEHQETVVESRQSTSTVTHESASGLMIQVSDVRAGAELVIEPRIGVQLIEETDK